MTDPKLTQVQTAFYNRLISSAQFMTLTGGRIYNYVPQDTVPMPYCRYEQISGVQWGAKNERGIRMEYQVSVFSNKRGSQQCSEAFDLLYPLLHNQELTLASGQNVCLTLTDMLTRTDSDGITQHLITRWSLLLGDTTS